MPEFYHNLVTQKSFAVLKQLQKNFNFVLIGGWAVFLLTHSLKSKDIDLVVDFSELEKFRQTYDLVKNDRLKKYEVKVEEIDIDIYVSHYSNPGLPAKEILGKNTLVKEGFKIPLPEILLILKQQAHLERGATPKGEKDRLDILSLLVSGQIDFPRYKNLIAKYDKKDLLNKLRELILNTQAVPELNLNQHRLSRIKKSFLTALGEK